MDGVDVPTPALKGRRRRAPRRLSEGGAPRQVADCLRGGELSTSKTTCWSARGGCLDPPKKPIGRLGREDGSYKMQTFGVKTWKNHLFPGKFP
eukprot:4144219-Pyramimonas_sp.AAC.1